MASSHWTSQISYEDIASLLLKLSVCAVLMSFASIIRKYNEPLEAAHAHIDDDRYDLVEYGAASQPTLDLSYLITYEAVLSLLLKLSV